MDQLKSSGKLFEISKWEVWEAYRQVKANQGAPGVDRVTIGQLRRNHSAVSCVMVVTGVVVWCGVVA